MEEQKSLKALTLALIFSGALNIGLIATGVFSLLEERQISFSVPPIRRKDATPPQSTNGQIMEAFSKLGFRELVSYLTNRDLIEEGYTKRDLALAALVTYHHFNLEKALGAPPEQQRRFQISDGSTLTVFPGLNEEQFEGIIRFAYEEKWPLTAEGLFQIVRSRPKPRDPSLEQTLCITPEFYSLQTLFQKTEAPQPAALLLDLISEGSWDLFNRFAHEQEQLLDLSVEKRRRLLLSYLALHSPVAAELLLTTDFSFAVKRMEDQGILDILSLISKTAEANRFCVELLRSPRSDKVWRAAAERLYAFAGETIETPIDLKAAVARFTGVPLPAAPSIEKRPAARTHIVKEGENLWKIARQYRVDLEEIVKLNDLDKDRLYPGMTLKIPSSQGTGSEPPR